MKAFNKTKLWDERISKTLKLTNNTRFMRKIFSTNKWFVGGWLLSN